MKRSARPNSRCRSCSKLTICALTETSSADRLVADDQIGLGGERAGDADALALAPGEFVRASVHRVARQPDDLHQFGNARIALGSVLGEAEIVDRLGQDVADPHPRVEAGERILEHHLHAAAHLAQPMRAEIVDAQAVEHDLAGGDVEQPEDGAADGRLAAAGLADQRQRLAARDLERYAVDRMHLAFGAAEQAARDREVLLEVVDLEQRHGHAAACSLAAK